MGSKECVEYDNVRLVTLRRAPPPRPSLSRHASFSLSMAPGVISTSPTWEPVALAPPPACSPLPRSSRLPPPPAPSSRGTTGPHPRRQPPGVPAETRAAAERGSVPAAARAHSRRACHAPTRAPARRASTSPRRPRSCPSWRAPPRNGKAHRALRRPRRALPIVRVVVVVGVLELVRETMRPASSSRGPAFCALGALASKFLVSLASSRGWVRTPRSCRAP